MARLIQRHFYRLNFRPVQQLWRLGTELSYKEVVSNPGVGTNIGTPVRCYSWNPLERRSYETLLSAMTGGRGGRGGRGRKKGAKQQRRGDPFYYVGQGKKGVRWPGLSAPLPDTRYGPEWLTKDLGMKVVEEGDDEEKWTKARISSNLPGEKRPEVSVADKGWSRRGWSGKSWGGRYVGCPELPNKEPLKGFQAVVIELRRVANQTKGGKKRSMRALVVVGNKDGAAGFAIGKADDAKSAIRKAKNKAALVLHFIPRCDGHTIYHNLNSKYCKTKILMERKVPGHGLRCQRAVAAICDLVGIKDLRAKIIGSSNPMNIVQATFEALKSQETHQDLAEKSGLHVVEMRRELDYRPVVVASPKSSPNAVKEVVEDLEMGPIDSQEHQSVSST